MIHYALNGMLNSTLSLSEHERTDRLNKNKVDWSVLFCASA